MKIVFISLLVITGIAGVALMLMKGGSGGGQVVSANNVVLEDGKQVVTITAKGGYTPRASVAKAGVPTVIRFDTNGTFDCSSSVRIPSMNISRYLPQSGVTDIDVGVQQVSTLQGMCGMGMYLFEVKFD